MLGELLRSRRSVRDFLPRPIAPELLQAVLADANTAPSWSNTQPWRVAVASGAVRDQLQSALCERYDTATRAQRGGWLGKLRLLVTPGAMPDGDFKTNLAYPQDLQPRRRDTGHGLYALLGIARNDHAAREQQMRRNFEFFGAPTVLFVFVHAGLREFSVLDAGIWLQSLMLSAQAHGLATCAQGALATWAGPVRAAFDVPPHYKLICGVSIGYASEHPVNRFNPGRAPLPVQQVFAR
ncbi:MAG: nitroreductase [Ramlibacter sp.]|nr:nitroreductase [Ramlibacter sp.]